MTPQEMLQALVKGSWQDLKGQQRVDFLSWVTKWVEEAGVEEIKNTIANAPTLPPKLIVWADTHPGPKARIINQRVSELKKANDKLA